eukprot:COSAG02_NODE_227_length_28153_cov_11.662294_6_plen_505_part_00
MLRTGQAANPEYVAAFEREMKRRREQQQHVGRHVEEAQLASRVVSAAGRLIVAVAVLLPALSYTVALHSVEHGLPSLIMPNGIELKIITESEAAEASLEIKKAADAIAWAGASKKESHWTGKSIAPSGQVLARVLMNMSELVHDNRVVELGSGCAMAGLAAGTLAARETYLTDQVAFMAKANLDQLLDDGHVDARSSLWNVRVKRLQWGDAKTIKDLQPPFRLVLGSDLLYRASDHDLLAGTVESLSDPSTVVLFATPAVGDPYGEGYERCLDGIDGTVTCSDGAAFFDKMRKLGFAVEDITLTPAVQAALLASSPPPSIARDMLEKFSRHAAPLDVRVVKMQQLPPDQRQAARSLRVVSVAGKLELRAASRASSTTVPTRSDSQPPPPQPAVSVDNIVTCANNPCHNSATCTSVHRPGVEAPGFRCACTDGWEGNLCDLDVDECASAPCLNGGHCFDSLSDGANRRYGLRSAVYHLGQGEYTCECGDGYVGANCDIEDEAWEM